MISFFHRYLDPAESLAEILFGLIMVLTCTLGAGVIGGTDQVAAHPAVAALGCNVAWGVIDAALYVMGNLFVRSHKVAHDVERRVDHAPGEVAAHRREQQGAGFSLIGAADHARAERAGEHHDQPEQDLAEAFGGLEIAMEERDHRGNATGRGDLPGAPSETTSVSQTFQPSGRFWPANS